MLLVLSRSSPFTQIDVRKISFSDILEKLLESQQSHVSSRKRVAFCIPEEKYQIREWHPWCVQLLATRSSPRDVRRIGALSSKVFAPRDLIRWMFARTYIPPKKTVCSWNSRLLLYLCPAYLNRTPSPPNAKPRASSHPLLVQASRKCFVFLALWVR